jgi:hypothetical protein
MLQAARRYGAIGILSLHKAAFGARSSGSLRFA